MYLLHVFLSVIIGTIVGLVVTLVSRNHFIRPYNNTKCFAKLERSQRRSRPRSLRAELESKQLVFIGVLTAEKFLDTRADAVYKTWAEDLPGQLNFFMSAGKEKKLKPNGLPIISLQGVKDNEYPPQKKVMAMLRYMHKHYIDKFQWFMRADDDIYVRPEKLKAFLATLDSSTDVVVGQGGVGRDYEKNKLGLIRNECYCLGGTGVIMSTSVLRKITPNIEHCLQDTASTHEDVELGRCIRKFAGVSCLWAIETQDLFHQDYQSKPYHGMLNTPILNKAITLHPVKEPAYMFRLHVHFLSQKMSSLQNTIFKNGAIIKMIKTTTAWTKQSRAGQVIKLRARNADFYHQENNTGSFNGWTLVNYQLFGFVPYTFQLGIHQALKKTIRQLNINERDKRGSKKTRPLEITNHKLHYCYYRVTPTHGVEFSLVLSTKMQGAKLRFPWAPIAATLHRKQLQNAFSEIQSSILDNSWKLHDTVHFIVPLMGRLKYFQNFLESLQRAFLVQGENIAVLVVYFPEMSQPEKHLEVYKKYQKKFPRTMLRWVNVPGVFNRAKALQKGVEIFGNNSLLFFSDVDFIFKNEFVYRCRSNTIQGKQVYLPIIFSQFNHSISYFGTVKPKNNFVHTAAAGMWRVFAFGAVCIYAGDAKAVKGLDTNITGWGLEDLTFAEKVLESGLVSFRSHDPGIVHVFHVHTPCNKTATEKQQIMCQKSVLSTYAPKSGLVKYMRTMKYIE